MKKIMSILVVFVLGFVAVGCTVDDADTDKEDKKQEETKKEEKKELTYGDVIEFDGLEIVFSEPVTFATIDNQYSDLNGSEVAIVPVKITNTSDDTNGLNMFYYKVYGTSGSTLDDVSAFFDDDVAWTAGTDSLRSGASVDTLMHFIYDGNGDYYIKFDNMSEKIEVKLSIAK
ncbi:hypothetical protein M2475_002161 [Breznakia sp. PF5-3]|uniref:hypothetical protein n=1 Tax=unclassified Breznakia TaxID=2623764 RepID=UPI0024067A0F|nr:MULTISPECIES: hypothetical protein [unclassified Breznakia]MDF9825775.1 hypothetical protein [Breznakia sp. PM6-1]MDF9836580.1 hypothetical protein [Breznakia sp. PF5-3]MDF9838808.1 hypothetical protein [Breznakia sp. PFB2-8]MDF9860834.1 hypothetical protein [Breznakia sp. PH5-24]